MQCLQELKYPVLEDGNQVTLAHISSVLELSAVMTKHIDG